MPLRRTHLATAVARLAEAGVASPRADAEILLAHCSDLSEEENARQTKVMAERGLY